MKHFDEINPEVFQSLEPVVRVGRPEIEELKKRASANPRQRCRILAHKTPADRLHEMLIVLTKDVYVRPHKHLGKPESFHVMDGMATVVFFKEDGEIDELVELGDPTTGRPYYFRNDDERYHTQIITTSHFAFHETTVGPFRREDMVFSPWSPDEKDPAAVQAYLAALRARVAKHSR